MISLNETTKYRAVYQSKESPVKRILTFRRSYTCRIDWAELSDIEYPSRTYLTAETSHASQRWLKAALALNKCGKCPISQQQHPTSSSTPSDMASTSRCWQYVPRNSRPRTYNIYITYNNISLQIFFWHFLTLQLPLEATMSEISALLFASNH